MFDTGQLNFVPMGVIKYVLQRTHLSQLAFYLFVVFFFHKNVLFHLTCSACIHPSETQSFYLFHFV